MYLHPVLIGIFLLVFAVLAVIGGIRLAKQRRFVMAGFLFVTMAVFGSSGIIAFTI